MKDIQTNAIKLYYKNLVFLKHFDKDLQNKIITIADMIDSGEYKERYNLEYIQNDKNFDIYDTVEKKYIYDKKPSKFVEEAVNNTNLDKKNSFDLLNSHTYNTKQPFIIEEDHPLHLKEQLLYRNDIFEYIKIFKKSTAFKKKEYKYIEKFIFVGTLLGSHIVPIHNKLNSSLYLIYEQNLEIFRLSMFVTDYSQLVENNNKIIFSIMDDEKVLEDKLANYIKYAIRSNHHVKYYCTNYNIHNFFDKLVTVTSHLNPLAYPYTKMYEGLLKPFFNNIKSYPILNTIKKHTLLNNYPVLFIAAGPSLERNIAWVIENQNKFIIISVGAAVKKLIKHDVLPDIITSADADEIVANQFSEDILDKIKKIPFLTSSITNNKVLSLFDKRSTILYEVLGKFKDFSTNIYGYSIGEVTLTLCSILGAEKIYMLGSDLALDQDSGASHVDNHIHSSKYEISQDSLQHNAFMKSGTYSLGKSTILVKGNFRDEVLTTLTFAKSIKSYKRVFNQIQQINKKTKIYNLNDGAFIYGTIPTMTEDIELKSLINKPSSKNITEYLAKSSEFGFNNIEENNLLESIKVIEQILTELEKFSNLETDTYDSYLNQQMDITTLIHSKLKKFTDFFLDRIFLSYILAIEPYLGYQFNDKDIDDSKYIIEVKEIWIKHIKRLCNDYKSIILNGINTTS